VRLSGASGGPGGGPCALQVGPGGHVHAHGAYVQVLVSPPAWRRLGAPQGLLVQDGVGRLADGARPLAKLLVQVLVVQKVLLSVGVELVLVDKVVVWVFITEQAVF